MAERINAIGTYSPRIQQGDTVQQDELVRWISRATGLNESGVLQVLAELRDAVIYHNQLGRAVKLQGLGTYAPSIRLNGDLSIKHIPASKLKKALNNDGAFQGQITNAEYIGLATDDLVAIWNENHPEDPIA
jgi:hypothetical protein